MTTIVKIVFENDIRRIALQTENAYEHLIQEVNRIYSGRFPNGVQVRYVDDEDDCVTVTSNPELKDAFEMSDATLKLFITPKSAEEEEAEYVKVSKDGQRTAILTKQESKDGAEIVREAKVITPQEVSPPQEENVKSNFDKLETAEAEEAKAKEVAKAEEETKAKEAAKVEEKAKAKEKAQRKAEAAQKAQKQVERLVKASEKAAAKAKREAIKAQKQAEKAAKEAEKAARKAKKQFRAGLSSVFIKDLTYEDGVEVEVGTKITKTWLLKNNGKSPWTSEVYLGKLIKGKLNPVPDSEVPDLLPGKEGEVSVTLSLPTKEGKFRTPNFFLCYDGKKFGDRFWATVTASKSKSADHKLAEVPVEDKPKKSYSQVAKDSVSKTDVKKIPVKEPLGAHFVRDVNFPDNCLVAPGQAIKKTWVVKNTGPRAWPRGTKLVSLDGSTFGQDSTATIMSVVGKGEQYNLSIHLVAPLETGKHTARFQLVSPQGEKFGHKYWINIQVSKFPSNKELKSMAMEFLANKEVVDILQEEFPVVIKEIRQGKKLASIVEIVLTKRPELKKHQFVIFIRPFLQSAERFMGFQLDALVSMYSFWAMTPFSNGAIASMEEKSPKEKEKSPKEEKHAAKETPKKEIAKKSQVKEEVKEAPSRFKYEKELQHFAELGFKNLEAVKPLLLKHKGSVPMVFNELFPN